MKTLCKVREGASPYLSAGFRREWVTVRSSLSPADHCEDTCTHQDFPHSQVIREPANMREEKEQRRDGERRGGERIVWQRDK